MSTQQLGKIAVGENSTAGTGLLAQYFSDASFTNLVLTKTDSTIDFNWHGKTPDPAIRTDYSVRWTGQLSSVFSERYTFHMATEGKARLWVNDKLVIDDWTDHDLREVSGSFDLVAGQQYNIRMDFVENINWGVAKLSWSSSSQTKQIIPQSQLSTPLSASSSTTDLSAAAVGAEPVLESIFSPTVTPKQAKQTELAALLIMSLAWSSKPPKPDRSKPFAITKQLAKLAPTLAEFGLAQGNY